MMDSHTIIGRIGSLPRFSEYKGETVCNVNIAVNRGEDKTSWYNVAVWGDAAERLRQDFVKAGIIMVAEVKNLYAEAYLNKEGKPQAQLKCTAIRFRLINPTKAETDPMPEIPKELDEISF